MYVLSSNSTFFERSKWRDRGMKMQVWEGRWQRTEHLISGVMGTPEVRK